MSMAGQRLNMSKVLDVSVNFFYNRKLFSIIPLLLDAQVR